MYCRKCGKEILDDSEFCCWCGEKVIKNSDPGSYSDENGKNTAEQESISDSVPEPITDSLHEEKVQTDTEINTKPKKFSSNNKRKRIALFTCGSVLLSAAIVFVILLITHVICFHSWAEADCLAPKTCSICGRTEGKSLGHDFSEATCTEDSFCIRCGEIGEKALGHDWQEATCIEDAFCRICHEPGDKATGHSWTDATCTEPKTCGDCGLTDGKAKGHKWQDATCTKSKTCSVCKKTSGKALGHDWAEATTSAPKTCRRCGDTMGEKLKSYDVYFSVDEIVSSAGMSVGGAHGGFVVLGSVSSSNGSAYANTENYYGAINVLKGVSVSGAAAGKVTISGTVCEYGLDSYEGQAVTYEIQSRYFSLTKTVD